VNLPLLKAGVISGTPELPDLRVILGGDLAHTVLPLAVQDWLGGPSGIIQPP